MKKSVNIGCADRVKQYPSGTLHADDGLLFCTCCNVTLDHTRKGSIDRHLKTPFHAEKRRLWDESEQRSAEKQATITGSFRRTTDSRDARNVAHLELVQAFTTANIPLNKLDHPRLRDYLQTNVKNLGALPTSPQLRSHYLPKIFDVLQQELSHKIAPASSDVIAADEVSDSHNRVGNTSDNPSAVEITSPSYAFDFMSQLFQLYQQGICCDIFLLAGDYKIAAHRVVLAASSEYFKSLFEECGTSKDVIVLPCEINSDNLQSLITFLYTGSLYLNVENVAPVLSAAKQLQIKTAMDLCLQFLEEQALMASSMEHFNSRISSNEQLQSDDFQVKEEVASVEDTAYIKSDCESDHQETLFAHQETLFADYLLKTNFIEPNQLSKSATVKLRRITRARQSRPKKSQSSISVSSKDEDGRSRSKRVIRRKSDLRSCISELSNLKLKRQRVCNLRLQVQQGLTRICRKPRHSKRLQSLTVKMSMQLLHRSIFTQHLNACLMNSVKSDCSQVFHCLPCRLDFNQALHYKVHLMKTHCCKYKTRNHYLFGIKQSFCRRTRSNLPPYLYRCSACNRSFLYMSTLKSHCVNVHKQHSQDKKSCQKGKHRHWQKKHDWHCPENDCGLCFTSKFRLKKHLETAHSSVTYSCPDCKFTSQVEKTFLRHRDQRHGALKMCHICGKGCSKPHLLREHLYVHHKIKDPSLKLFQCAWEGCGYECISKLRLEDHCRRHTLIKSLKCDVCGKAFKHSIGLERHVKAFHQGIRPFICDQCGMTFGNEHELKTHTARHSNLKPHACNLCPFRSYNKSNLNSHLFSQHNIQTDMKISVYQCDQCQFKTSHRARYDDHVKKHNNIKDVECPECGKTFFSKGNLYGHTMKVHRPKSFCCSFCNFSTAIRGKFKSHLRKIHNQDSNNLIFGVSCVQN